MIKCFELFCFTTKQIDLPIDDVFEYEGQKIKILRVYNNKVEFEIVSTGKSMIIPTDKFIPNLRQIFYNQSVK